jgi:hypothetical protein
VDKPAHATTEACFNYISGADNIDRLKQGPVIRQQRDIGGKVIDHLGTTECMTQGLQVTDITLDYFRVKSGDCPLIYMNQRAYRAIASNQGTYQISADMPGGTGYYYRH